MAVHGGGRGRREEDVLRRLNGQRGLVSVKQEAEIEDVTHL